ncbi:unnamed protein product [Urochloa humidicola]
MHKNECIKSTILFYEPTLYIAVRLNTIGTSESEVGFSREVGMRAEQILLAVGIKFTCKEGWIWHCGRDSTCGLGLLCSNQPLCRHSAKGNSCGRDHGHEDDVKYTIGHEDDLSITAMMIMTLGDELLYCSLLPTGGCMQQMKCAAL